MVPGTGDAFCATGARQGRNAVDEQFRVGVFSPNDPRPWVRSENLDMMLAYEGHLVSALRERE